MLSSIHNFLERSLTPLVYVLAAFATILGMLMLNYVGWQTLWLPILLTMAGPFVFPIVLFPAAFFSGVMQVTEKEFPLVSTIFAGAALGYFAAILSVVTAAIVLNTAGHFNTHHALLTYGWSMVAPILPWAVFALRDRKNYLFIGMIWMLVLANYASLVFFKGQEISFSGYFFSVFCLMAVMLALQAFVEKKSVKPSSP
jgi:hypothetical protein